MKHIPQALSVLVVMALALAALPTGNVYADTDVTGPITSAVAATPNPAAVGDTVTVTATVDDTTTGGSNILSAEFNVNGGSFTTMTAADGAFDSATENVTGTFTAQAGDNQICVQGTDAANNVGTAVCTTFTVTVADTQGPITSAVAVTPNPVTLTMPATVTATVDDTTTGNSNIQSAEFTVDGGTTWTAMTATDGAFDSPTEDVTGTFTAAAGQTQVCVRGTDAANNVGDQTCASLTTQSKYTFTGFFRPIRNAGTRAKAGSVVPVKWRLTLASDGTPVNTRSAIVAVESYAVDCTTREGDITTAIVAKGPGRAALRPLGNGRWIFNWKTAKVLKNSCRMMFVLFDDGSMSPAVFFRLK